MPAITYSAIPLMTRAELATEQNAVYAVPLTELRVWDAMHTNLPGTAATDDCALITGTLGTDSLTIQAGDLKAAGATTRYASFEKELAVEYKAGGSVAIRAKAGAKTTVSDGTMTLDFQVYRVARDGTVGADICATAAQSINSLTLSDYSFTITPTTLNPGDKLHVRMALACNDGATVTAVIPIVGGLEVLTDIRG